MEYLPAAVWRDGMMELRNCGFRRKKQQIMNIECRITNDKVLPRRHTRLTVAAGRENTERHFCS